MSNSTIVRNSPREEGREPGASENSQTSKPWEDQEEGKKHGERPRGENKQLWRGRNIDRNKGTAYLESQ